MLFMALVAGLATRLGAQQSSRQAIEPPLVRQLQADLNRVDRPDSVVQGFWSGLTRSGTPIVETIGDSHGSTLQVSFYWHGDSATHAVALITPLALLDIQASALSRVEGTDVWYKSLNLPSDTRFAYRFSINDNLVPFEKETNFGARMAGMRADPLNRKVFDYGPFGTMSILELPAAPSDSLIRSRPGMPAGTLEQATIPSKASGESRTVTVYVPPNYAKGTGAQGQRSADPSARRSAGVGPPARLIVLMDGESYQSLLPTPTILNNLIAQRAIPPVIAVLVHNPADTRDRDLNCNPDWDRFIVSELVPWVTTRYRVSDQPEQRVIGGFSLGGLAAACVAIRNPNVFGNVIAQSGSFYRASGGDEPEWVARRLAASQRLPLRFNLSIGRFETAAIPNRDPSMLTASRHLRDVLKAKGYDVAYQELSSGHEHVAWRAILGDAIGWGVR